MSIRDSGEPRQGRPDGFLGLLRAVALVAVVAGAVGSVVFMLRVGHRNPSRLLLVLFTVWVLSPFVALVWATMVSKRWSVLTRATLYTVTLILTVGSLAIYRNVVLTHPAKPASFFLVVPFVSWLLMTIVPLAALISGRLSRRGMAA
jgi:hypothetical protein